MDTLTIEPTYRVVLGDSDCFHIMVVGASGVVDGSSPFPGRAFIYEHDGNEWVHKVTLHSPDLGAGAQFGQSVAIKGNTIVVSAPLARSRTNIQCGAAYVYRRDRDTWESSSVDPVQVLFPKSPNWMDTFGANLALEDGWLFVGAPQDDSEKPDAGSVTIFKWEPAIDRFVRKQIVDRPHAVKREHFGIRILVDGDMAIISASNLVWHSVPGTVHIYRLDDKTDRWGHTQTLKAGPERKDGDHFGRSLSLWRTGPWRQHRLVIGVTGADDQGEHSGAALIFQRRREGSDLVWEQEARLAPPATSKGDHFGFSTAIAEGLLLVGAMATDGQSLRNFGRSYVYWENTESDHNWLLVGGLESNPKTESEQFGFAQLFYWESKKGQYEAAITAPGGKKRGIHSGVVYILGESE